MSSASRESKEKERNDKRPGPPSSAAGNQSSTLSLASIASAAGVNVSSITADKSSSSSSSSSSSASSAAGGASLATITIPKFSPQLEAALKEVLPSDDPLDSADFDAVAFINKQFPDEASLVGGKLDSYLSQLRRRVVLLSEQITRDVREHSCQRSQTETAISQAKNAIEQLFKKMSAIKDKARQSEVMVQEISRDIHSLDNAKKHLTATIRALRNLHMLVSAIQQLDLVVADKSYRDAANILKAISDLFTLFEAYKEVPKIKLLRQSVELTKKQLREQLMSEFRSLLPSPNCTDREVAQLLSSGCAVIDELESSVKNDLFDWFTSNQMSEYTELYGYGKDGGSIDQVDRRYAWLRRWFDRYQDRFAPIFPAEWELSAYVTREFCKLTRHHLTKYLQVNKEKLDINVMIKSLQATIQLEKELNVKFRGVSQSDELNEWTKDAEVDAIKRKYRKHDGKDVEEKSKAKAEEKAAAVQKASTYDFSNAISEAFTPYMGAYVELERKQIQEQLDKIDRAEAWNASEAKDRFAGIDQIFIFIKNSVSRCSKLTRNSTFYSLFQEYVRGLSLYADILAAHTPIKTEGLEFNSPSEVIRCCLVINTVNYCTEALPGLEESVRKLIDEQFKEKISVQSLDEKYRQLATTAINSLVNSMITKLNRCLLNMTRQNWQLWTSVGDESGYAKDIEMTFRSEMPVIGGKLEQKYLTRFWGQIADKFIPLYIENIFRCKRIGEIAAQQMSLDAQVIKRSLLQVPYISAPGQTIDERKRDFVSRAYKKVVQGEMSRAEALLKTLVSPSERFIITFKALLPKATAEDLVKVMNLRGISKPEQKTLVDAYNSSGIDSEDRIILPKEGTGIPFNINVKSIFQAVV